MMRLVIPGLLLTALAAHAGEPVITETANGISVEYTGTATAKESAAATGTAAASGGTSTPVNPGQVARVRFLAAQIRQLNQEASAALKLTGNETDEELAAKNALAAEKQVAANRFADEYGKITGNPPPPPPPTDPQSDAISNDFQQSQFQKQRNDREERIRHTRETRRGSGSVPDPAP